MAITLVNMSKSKVISELDTYNYTALASDEGVMTVSAEVNVNPPSGISIDIQLNSVSQDIIEDLPVSQSHAKLEVKMNVEEDDVISIVISSSEDSDTGPNAIKGIINIRPGLV